MMHGQKNIKLEQGSDVLVTFCQGMMLLKELLSQMKYVWYCACFMTAVVKHCSLQARMQI